MLALLFVVDELVFSCRERARKRLWIKFDVAWWKPLYIICKYILDKSAENQNDKSIMINWDESSLDSP